MEFSYARTDADLEAHAIVVDGSTTPTENSPLTPDSNPLKRKHMAFKVPAALFALAIQIIGGAMALLTIAVGIGTITNYCTEYPPKNCTKSENLTACILVLAYLALSPIANYIATFLASSRTTVASLTLQWTTVAMDVLITLIFIWLPAGFPTNYRPVLYTTIPLRFLIAATMTMFSVVNQDSEN